MDKDFWLNLAVTTILMELKAVVKNQERKDRLKGAMLKIASTIFAIWGDDPGFEDSLFAKAEFEKSKMNV